MHPGSAAENPENAAASSSGHEDPNSAQSYAASRSTLGVSAVASRGSAESFSASQSTLGISSSSGVFPDADPEPAPAARSNAALPLAQASGAAPVSHRQLWLVLGAAAVMMVIGVTALVIALTQ